jgi:hypothetical protein
VLASEPEDIWLENIKSPFSHLKILDFDENCLLVLGAFKSVDKLTVVGDALPNDLQAMSNLTNLSWLDIRNQAEIWPSFYILPMPQVQTLRLMCFSDEWPYFDNKDFPNLINLHIFSKEEYTNINNVRVFKKLKYLHLACPDIPSLAPLSIMPQLETIELSTLADNFPEVIVGIDELSGLRKLIINLEVGKRSDIVIDDIKEDVEMMRVGLAPCKIILNTDWSEKKW